MTPGPGSPVAATLNADAVNEHTDQCSKGSGAFPYTPLPSQGSVGTVRQIYSRLFLKVIFMSTFLKSILLVAGISLCSAIALAAVVGVQIIRFENTAWTCVAQSCC